MSRTLPGRPNLDYLKKEAKDRLDDLRRTDPSAQLAEAQFALSREYGFDSWPKLKAHVEAIATAFPERLMAGAWIANVAQSRRHPANPFKSARMHVTVNGDSVDIMDEFVDETGRSVRGRNHLDVDGVERERGNGYTVSATWNGSGLDALAKKDGLIIGRVTYAVSSDGRSLTVVDASGASAIVFDRLIQ